MEVDNILSSAGAAVTGLSVDPNDPNHVVVTVGGYGSSSAGKVRETFNAVERRRQVGQPLEQHMDGLGLEFNHALLRRGHRRQRATETIVVGTEFGIFVTENGGSILGHQQHRHGERPRRCDRTSV